MPHIKDILAGGIPVFKRKFSRFLHGIWAVPAVLVIRLLRPWLIIRTGTFVSQRIGHFVAEAGIYWAKKTAPPDQRYLDLYWLPAQTSNDFWAKIVRRNFRVYNFVLFIDLWNKVIPGGTIHNRPSISNGSRDIYGILEKAGNKMAFLPEENKEAISWLKRQGWTPNTPFVCLMVRDNAYLNKDKLNVGHDWSYHNYRDSDIATYTKASEWLADQGVWVIRMGKIMQNRMPTKHPKIIDYAFHPERSDFLDIWLFANCSLCISTGTGPDCISDVYRIPLLMVNYTPIKNLFSWSNAIHLPKHLVWSSSGKLLSMKENLYFAFHQTKEYQQQGIEIQDLSEHEILSAVQEAWLSLTGAWTPSPRNTERQNQIWEIVKADPEFSKYHGYVHPQSRFGDHWLATRPEDFFQ